MRAGVVERRAGGEATTMYFLYCLRSGHEASKQRMCGVMCCSTRDKVREQPSVCVEGGLRF